MEEMIYAPIIIPTLNRFEHFRACVESLANCSGADKTDLFISVDYPPSEKYMNGYKEIIDFVNSGIKGFKKVYIYIQEKNLGVGGNLYFLRDIVFSKYDRLICTEDDNIFSPCFLEYINKGLEKHGNNKHVLGICGYNYPITMPQSYCNKYNYYYAKEFSAWGTGYLKERISEANIFMNVEYGKTIIKKHWRKLTWNIRRIIIDSIKRHKLYGDLNRTLYLIDTDSYCVFPTENLVVNKGHDGSGVNCGNSKNDKFSKQHQSREMHFDFQGDVPLCENRQIRKELNKYFDIPFKSRIKVLIESWLYRR